MGSAVKENIFNFLSVTALSLSVISKMMPHYESAYVPINW
uniref:Uncharacterized protein n=1 Tax=Vibrio fluvialis TaxID=676 RepID=C9E5W1_VIBFL|nr:hypothetical protein ICEVFLIND1_0102 [Vibrio fluvialis Ind1]